LKSQLFCSVKVFFDDKTKKNKKNAFLEATNRAKHNPDLQPHLIAIRSALGGEFACDRSFQLQ